MNRVILQVPIEKDLREKAQSAALSQGFSSLQEVIRVLLTKIANKEMKVTVSEPVERLTSAQERKYAKIVRDIKQGKNVTKTNSLDELFTYLNA